MSACLAAALPLGCTLHAACTAASCSFGMLAVPLKQPAGTSAGYVVAHCSMPPAFLYQAASRHLGALCCCCLWRERLEAQLVAGLVGFPAVLMLRSTNKFNDLPVLPPPALQQHC